MILWAGLGCSAGRHCAIQSLHTQAPDLPSRRLKAESIGSAELQRGNVYKKGALTLTYTLLGVSLIIIYVIASWAPKPHGPGRKLPPKVRGRFSTPVAEIDRARAFDPSPQKPRQ